jgi:hypothetical protein
MVIECLVGFIGEFWIHGYIVPESQWIEACGAGTTAHSLPSSYLHSRSCSRSLLQHL